MTHFVPPEAALLCPLAPLRPACGGLAPRPTTVHWPRLTSRQMIAVKWVIINDLWYKARRVLVRTLHGNLLGSLT